MERPGSVALLFKRQTGSVALIELALSTKLATISFSFVGSLPGTGPLSESNANRIICLSRLSTTANLL